jgi:hypothetical protein
MPRFVLLFPFVLALTAGGGGGDGGETTPAHHEEHAGGEAHHEHHFPPAVESFHQALAPAWHSEPGDTRRDAEGDASAR